MKSVSISFPETLKRLMARGFFSFPEMLVAINREGGFGEFPPLQYMMQALPASGFLRPVMSAESLAEIDRLATDFMVSSASGGASLMASATASKRSRI